MKIDLFNHFFPESYYREIIKNPLEDPGLMARIVAIDTLHDLDLRISQVESFGPDYCQVLSLPGPDLVLCSSPERSVELARIANEGLADIVKKNPGHFPAFVAALPMDQPEKAVQEARYAIEHLGARGIEIYTNVGGKPIDREEYFPLWQYMNDCQLPILLHPARTDRYSDYSDEEQSEYGMWMTLGWPYETSVAMVRLVYAGLFESFPDIKVVVHHAGAMIPMFWQRVNSTGSSIARLKKKPAEYLKLFYADTALFGNKAGTVCGLDFFGADHFVFASDSPFGPASGDLFISSAVSVVDSLAISDADREKIYYKNAQALLKL